MSKKDGTKLCKHCKTEIPAGAKICPNCQKKQGGIAKWIIIAVVVLGIIGIATGGSDEKEQTTSPTASNTVQETEANDTKLDAKSDDTDSNENESVAKTDDASTTENENNTDAETNDTDANDMDINEVEDTSGTDSSATMGQRNALAKANDYLSFTSFSYSGLIKQLEFEGFTTEEATYGADNCGADWNEQAAGKAKEYLDISSFSRSGLIEQLKFEGFTDEQAEYGATAVGY